jgi:drug/metabolite transporter (DMT)-like permease
MSWLVFAFSGPVLWAISVHLDKYLVSRYFAQSSVAVLLVFTALLGLVLLPPIYLFRPDVVHLPFGSMALIGFSGLLYMTAIFFYLQALQWEEASVVAPFFQAAPLFGYLLGYFVLGEQLSAMQMFGGGLIVVGGALLSVGFGTRREFKTRLIVLMLACAFALALTGLIFKFYAVRDEFWTATFWAFVGQALFGAVLLAIRAYRRQFVALLRANLGPILAIAGANELINLGGILGARYALLFAPLSLVQAIGSTTALFVFAIGAVLSIFYPALGREDLSAANLMQKAASAILIAAGAILVNWWEF